MSQIHIARSAEGIINVSGELTIDSVASAWQLEPGGGSAATLTVDLKGVTKADSSALALLIDWLAQARQSGGSVTFTNIPEQLVTIARLSDVDELIGIAPETTATEGAV